MSAFSPNVVSLGGRLQGVGLVCLTALSFFPRLSHKAEYLFFSLFALALALACFTNTRPWGRTAIDAPLLCFSAWVLLTIPFAVDIAYSFSEWRKLIAHVLLFYWVTAVLAAPERSKWVQGIMWAVVGGTVVLSLYGLVNFVLQGGSWRDRDIRAAVPMSDYNWLSTYMVLSLPIVAVGVVISRERVGQILFGFGMASGALAQLFSYTRAGWLGNFIQLGVGTWMVGLRRVSLSIAGIGLVAIWGLLAIASMGYQKDTARGATAETRSNVWQLAVQSIVAHPLVGVGYGNDTFIRVYADREEARRTLHPHNAYLMIAMGSGVPALLLFGWIVVEAGRALYTSFRISEDQPQRLLMLGVFLAGLGFLARNFFDYMLAGSLGTLFWILMATGLSIAKQVHPRVLDAQKVEIL